MVTKGRAGPVNTSLLNISRSSDQETREKKFQLGLLRTRDFFFFEWQDEAEGPYPICEIKLSNRECQQKMRQRLNILRFHFPLIYRSLPKRWISSSVSLAGCLGGGWVLVLLAGTPLGAQSDIPAVPAAGLAAACAGGAVPS